MYVIANNLPIRHHDAHEIIDNKRLDCGNVNSLVDQL